MSEEDPTTGGAPGSGRRRRRRRLRAGGGVAIVLAAAAAVVAVALPAGNSTPRFGLLGGYVGDFGPIDSIAAQWRVPAALGGARGAAASTWVGAQVIGGPAPQAFVQVGTTEALGAFYQAFWSDTEHGFHPQLLGSAGAGDLVRAELEQVSGGWRVTLDDLTSGDVYTDSSSEGLVGQAFDLAEWIQEDPTNGRTNQPEPYPSLTPVTFEHLAINGLAPAYAQLRARWISLPGPRYLAPTALTGDQFGFHAASVSATGNRYLDDVAAVNSPLNALLDQVSHWNAGTSTAQARADVAADMRALRSAAQTLADQRWPASIAGYIQRLVHANDATLADAAGAAVRGPRRSIWIRRLTRDGLRGGAAGNAIRRILQVPQNI